MPNESLLTHILRGKGAVAQAMQQAIAVATRGVYVGGDNSGVVNTGIQLTVNHYRSSPVEGKPTMSKRAVAEGIHAYLQLKQKDWFQFEDFVWKKSPAQNGVMQRTRLDLDRLYVPLMVQDVETPAAKPQQGEQLLASTGQSSMMLLAEAGQGKSTYLRYLAYQLATHLLKNRGWEDRPALRKALGFEGYHQLAIPVFFPLNVYADTLLKDEIGLAEFLDRRLANENIKLPPYFFNALIKHNKPLILLLDGLDEILDVALREKIAQQLKLLSQTPNVRVLATCRPAVYWSSEHVRIAGYTMRHYAVAPFNDKTLEQLLINRYVALRGAGDKTLALFLRAEIKQLEAQRQQSGQQGRLIDSPLMAKLAFEVREYTQQPLPTRRADFLSKAIEAALNANYAQDPKERALLAQAVGGWENHRNLLALLALEYSRHLSTGLPEVALREVLLAAAAPIPRVVELFAFARDRGGVLRQNREQAGRYEFVHLALRNYLAAWGLHLQTQAVTEAAAFFAAHNRMADENWREMALLYAGLRREAAENPLGNNDKLTEFVLALAGYAADVALSAAARFGCANVALQVAEEDIAAINTPLFAKLRGRLCEVAAVIIEDGAAMDSADLPARLRLGRWLNQHGDPRPHVMTVDAMRFCYVPPGPFLMGSDDTDPEAQAAEKCADLAFNTHGYDLKAGYWIGQYPISNAQYQGFIEDDGYANKAWWGHAIAAGVWQKGVLTKHELRGPAWANESPEKLREALDAGLMTEGEVKEGPAPELLAHLQRKPNHPATYITWYEAMAYCAWLTDRWQKKGWLRPDQRVRLPNEPEWEKAARGGFALPDSVIIRAIAELEGAAVISSHPNPLPRRRYAWGDDLLTSHMNVHETALGDTSVLGCFANGRSPYGCQELNGNGWEWTRSNWGPIAFVNGRYEDELQFKYPYDHDPQRENEYAGRNIARVLRGGAFYYNGRNARCASRNRDVSGGRYISYGFRVMLSPLSLTSEASGSLKL